jgi:hypothetical protein
MKDVVKALSAEPLFVLSQYRPDKKKVYIKTGKNVAVQIGSDIATFLGFSTLNSGKSKGFTPIIVGGKVGEYHTTLSGGINSLYVYTEIIKEQFVGGIKTPLLRIVNMSETANGGDIYTSLSYNKLYFAPMKSSLINTINIQIYDSEGHPLHFGKGRSVVILEFRKISNQ